jgi:hypothetical protein
MHEPCGNRAGIRACITLVRCSKPIGATATKNRINADAHTDR